MGSVKSQTILEQARLEKFHRQLKHFCSSITLFQRHLKVRMSHVSLRAAETDNVLRNVLSTSEVLASIITHGRVNEAVCQKTAPVRIAVEAKLAAFEWTDVSRNATIKEDIYVRVVVEDSSPKHIVVTVYPDRIGEIDRNLTPEVPHGIW